MKVFTTEQGFTVINGDSHIEELASGIDLEAPYWEYAEQGQTVRVDVRSYEPSLDVLSGLFAKAEVKKRPEWAAAYVVHKNRIIAMFENRDRNGAKYETGV